MSRVLLRYAGLFLLFAALLLLCLVPVYLYVTAFTLRDALTRMESRLDAGLAALDNTASALDDLVAGTAGDSRFRSLRLEELPGGLSPVTLTELRGVLSRYLLSRPLVADAGIVLDEDKIVTRESVVYYTPPFRYYGLFLRRVGLDGEDWRRTLREARPWAPAGVYESASRGIYEGVTYALPWAWEGAEPERTFFAVLPVDALTELLAEAALFSRGGALRLYDSQGRLLFSRGLGASSRDTGNGAGAGSAGARALRTLSRRSETSLLRAELDVPEVLLQEQTRPLMRLIVVFSVLVACLTLFLVAVFAWRGSRPVLEALSTIERQTALLQAELAGPLEAALRAGDTPRALTLLRDCARDLPGDGRGPAADLLGAMLEALVDRLKAEYAPALAGVPAPRDARAGDGGGNASGGGSPGVPGIAGGHAAFEQRFSRTFAGICAALKPPPEAAGPARNLDRKTLEFINRHLYDPALYITMAADHLGISAPTLQKILRRTTGQTFFAYVEERRLEKARELLAAGASIQATAAGAGFTSANSFYKAFKRRYGCPPSAAR